MSGTPTYILITYCFAVLLFVGYLMLYPMLREWVQTWNHNSLTKCTNLVAWSTESHEDRPQLPSRESRKLFTKWWTHLWVMWALDWTGGVAVWPGGLAGRRGPPEPPAPGASQAACNIRQPNAPPMLQESSLFSRSFWTNYSSCSLSLTSLHSSPVARTRLV